jgi:hypothetical protein
MLVCAKCRRAATGLYNSTTQPQLLICKKCKAKEKDQEKGECN